MMRVEQCQFILTKASPNAHREINSPPHAMPYAVSPPEGWTYTGTHGVFRLLNPSLS